MDEDGNPVTSVSEPKVNWVYILRNLICTSFEYLTIYYILRKARKSWYAIMTAKLFQQKVDF